MAEYGETDEETIGREDMGGVWQDDRVVCVHKLETESDVQWDDFARGAYELLRAMKPNPEGRRVVIKPNVTIPARPESGIITHAKFVGGIAEYFIRDVGLDGDRIAIAEGGGKGDMAQFWEDGGFAEVADEQGLGLINLNLGGAVMVNLPQGHVFKEIPIAQAVKDETCYLINVPKMKTHGLAITTLCMKNLMGTIVPIDGARHLCGTLPYVQGRETEITESGLPLKEESFCQKLSDLSCAVKPDLNVVEGIVGRDGTGFNRGRNFPTKLCVAGVNVVAVDAVTSYLMGFDPEEIGYLKIAARRGLGPHSLKDIQVYGVQDGELVRCEDVERFVWRPPFEVLRGE